MKQACRKQAIAPIWACAILWLACAPFYALADDSPPTTPQEVWRGYDPRAEPLEIEVLKTWKENGANYREFRFTGMNDHGSKVRVYAISSAPQGKKNLPAVLHIHGGGQTATTRWLRFWNERGYAAQTFDFCGKLPGRDKFTDWGTLAHGNMASTGSHLMATKPSVRDSSWYLWARISRRALTCMEQMDEVDANKLGVFGISVGGSLVWPVAAMDERVKAACAIYGVGWNTYDDVLGANDSRAENTDVSLWRKTMEAESYAPLVRCPLLFLNSTNDQHGNMDFSFRTLSRVPNQEVRQAYSPRQRHHIGVDQGLDLPLWMDAHLKGGDPFPKSPIADVKLVQDAVPYLQVRPDASKPIKRVELYYAIENRNPKNRYWRSVVGKRDADEWTAPLPIANIQQPLFAFANVLYASGVCLSSNLVIKLPVDLARSKPTDERSTEISDFANGLDGWVTRSPATDPIPPIPDLLKMSKGPDGRNGISVTASIPFGTHKLGDPKWRGPEGASLAFEVYAKSARKLRVLVHEHDFAPGALQYAKELEVQSAERWQPIVLQASDFTNDNAVRLKNWREATLLELESSGGTGDELVFSMFRWVEPKAKMP